MQVPEGKETNMNELRIVYLNETNMKKWLKKVFNFNLYSEFL